MRLYLFLVAESKNTIVPDLYIYTYHISPLVTSSVYWYGQGQGPVIDIFAIGRGSRREIYLPCLTLSQDDRMIWYAVEKT